MRAALHVPRNSKQGLDANFLHEIARVAFVSRGTRSRQQMVSGLPIAAKGIDKNKLNSVYDRSYQLITPAQPPP